MKINNMNISYNNCNNMKNSQVLKESSNSITFIKKLNISTNNNENKRK